MFDSHASPRGRFWPPYLHTRVDAKQSPELKPFLVHGAILEGKVNTAFFSIVTRISDETTATSPQAVHALLVAGRAASR